MDAPSSDAPPQIGPGPNRAVLVAAVFATIILFTLAAWLSVRNETIRLEISGLQANLGAIDADSDSAVTGAAEPENSLFSSLSPASGPISERLPGTVTAAVTANATQVDLAQSQKEQVDEPERFYPTTIANRLLTQDIDQRIEMVRAEARYGRLLDELGVVDPERAAILNGIAERQVAGLLASARFQQGEIDLSEMQATFREGFNYISEALGADAVEAITQFRREESLRQQRDDASMFIANMTRSGPMISVTSAAAFGDVYADTSREYRDRISGSMTPDQQLAMFVEVRERATAVIPPGELHFVDQYLAQKVNEIRMAERRP